ncbi:MAG: glycosyltransferase family 39 protein, partial [Solirubrobacteraceae bacterium]|nr:glycosyltransferase family 39 protein [Solirubrobacteraceae bacterium]
MKIGQPSLWWDEAATISAADRPVGELWDLVGHVDLVHGLYYVVMQFWVAVFGTSEVALRAPSAVALGVAIAGIVFLAARLTTPRAAWIAGLTAAILPGLSWSGIEAREWSIVTACVTWATYSLCVALDTRSKGRYVAYTVLMTLAAAFSVMAILMLPVHLWLGAKAHRARLVLLLATGISCLALPLLHASYAQRRQVSFIDLEATGLARQIVFNQIFMKDQNGSYGHEDVVQWVLAGAFLIAVVAALADRSRPAAVLGAVWIAVPTLILATPVLFGVQLYQARYLTYTAAGACLVMADGIDVLWSRYASRSSARVLLVLGAAVVTACASLAIVAQ